MSNPTGKGGFGGRMREYGLEHGLGRHPENRARFTSEGARAAARVAGERSHARAMERALTAARVAVRGSERDLGAVLLALYRTAYHCGYQAGLRWRKRQAKETPTCPS